MRCKCFGGRSKMDYARKTFLDETDVPESEIQKYLPDSQFKLFTNLFCNIKVMTIIFAGKFHSRNVYNGLVAISKSISVSGAFQFWSCFHLFRIYHHIFFSVTSKQQQNSRAVKMWLEKTETASGRKFRSVNLFFSNKNQLDKRCIAVCGLFE